MERADADPGGPREPRAAEPRPPRGRAWETWALAGLIALAFALRALHLLALRVHDPFYELAEVDGQLYDAQARSLLAGDGLGDGVLILGPGYPLFAASVYAVLGPSLAALKWVQAGIGAVDCLLVAHLARLHFDRATALLAAAFTALYGMLIFYAGTVMVVNLMVPLVLGSAILVTHALREPTALRWALAGLCISAAALARQTMLLYAVLVLPWIAYALRDRADRARRLRLAAAFGIGVALLVLPFTARNWLVGGDLVLLNSTGGINLYMGHNEYTDGTWVQPRLGMRADSPLAIQRAFTTVAEREAGRSLRPSEVSAFWSQRARDYIREQPTNWLLLELRKFLLFWNAREVWSNQSIDVSRSFSWVLRLPLLSFGVVAPLALVGIGASARRWRALFPLHAVIAVYLSTALIFFVLSRYRMPVVPVLLIFAAYAVTEASRWLRARRWRALAAMVACLAGFAALVNLDLGRENLFMAWYNLGNKYLALERYDEAIASYQRSLAEGPRYIPTWNNLALAHEGAGQRDEAIEVWRALLEWSVQTGDEVRVERAQRRLNLLGADPGPAADPPGPDPTPEAGHGESRDP